MKAIIIDDERLARLELRKMLLEFPEVEVIDEAVNAEDALAKIEALQPDLIFLDIQMPEKTGFDLLDELDSVPFVIFTTAYDEFALKAFEFNALDYLLKPIEPKRLEEAIKKVTGRKSIPEYPASDPMQHIPGARPVILSADDQVFVKDGDRCWFVRLSDVRVFESEGNYVRLFFNEYKPLILRTLNYLDERLDKRTFFRANRKFIINLKWIENIEPWLNGGLLVKMKDGQKVEVSRRQSIKFKEMLSL